MHKYICEDCSHISDEDFWVCPNCSDESRVLEVEINTFDDSMTLRFHIDIPYSRAINFLPSLVPDSMELSNFKNLEGIVFTFKLKS